jgi:membrane protein YqaA with SNARE-associated domain
LFHSLVDALVKFGPLGVFLIGVLESSSVPVPGGLDALLILVAWKSPATAYITATAATVGSLIGNILLFQTSRQGGRRFLKTPPPDAPQKFRRWFARYGLVTVLIPAMLPIPLPLKVFVISAGLFHTSFRNFLGVILVARLVRYFGLAYLGVQLGEHAKEFLKQNAWNLVGISIALGLVLYALVRFNDRRTVE